MLSIILIGIIEKWKEIHQFWQDIFILVFIDLAVFLVGGIAKGLYVFFCFFVIFSLLTYIIGIYRLPPLKKSPCSNYTKKPKKEK